MNQILEKISKTLRLGTNNNNENEAQTAILAAQRLMAKYHISQEEIDGFLDEKEDKAVEVIEEKAVEETNNEKWKRRLMIIIARNFRCELCYDSKKLLLIGEKEDIQIAKRIYMYAKGAILQNFRRFYNEKYKSIGYYKVSDRNRCKRDYAYGFIKGLSIKFEEQKKDSDLALVVVNPNVKDYMSKIKFSGPRRSRTSYIENSYCYRKGQQDGRLLADIDTTIKDNK